ncbi:LysR family transcriptional regulator [Legionella parisiensis]|uniref:Putative HTH-type transcriptional regulator YahB n=1 Tax=Legionella parisiensis TaxID=45071 RepID=A0A1E5JRC6_9GAMM|nr:LysR family transcriptional regulator [Legionella parisiensis]KTD42716.1 LysR family transporter transcriptional regulator [Legionella parisiensis]OEH47084.1 putative HTH-type transcriptional regulator YahB [Legionella parisiensis]STX71605.1 transcriptional regulator [Legionella parisiensis]
MDIDFDALRVFVVVVECGGFNAATRVLFKTQPAITSSIKKLEEQLNLVLFDRSHYRPELTIEGEKLYHRAQSLIGHWKNISQFAEQLQSEAESDITIAIDVFFPLSSLKNLLRHWINSFPNTQFHFRTESLGGACERLLRNQADLIISENLLTKSAVEVIPLRSEFLIAVASPEFIDYYSKQLGDLDTLSECMQVILRDSSQSDFSFGVVEHARRWTVSDVMAKKDIIVAGLGWGRLPLHMITHELADGSLQCLQGNHFDRRLITMGAIRLQKPARGPVAEKLWQDLNNKNIVKFEQ